MIMIMEYNLLDKFKGCPTACCIKLTRSKLSIGYARAARIFDKLEENGVISSFDNETKNRKVIKQ